MKVVYPKAFPSHDEIVEMAKKAREKYEYSIESNLERYVNKLDYFKVEYCYGYPRNNILMYRSQFDINITLNKYLLDSTKKYLLAYCIGLVEFLKCDFEIEYTIAKENILDVFATNFAYEFLMPLDEFENKYNNIKCSNDEKVSILSSITYGLEKHIIENRILDLQNKKTG